MLFPIIKTITLGASGIAAISSLTIYGRKVIKKRRAKKIAAEKPGFFNDIISAVKKIF